MERLSANRAAIDYMEKHLTEETVTEAIQMLEEEMVVSVEYRSVTDLKRFEQCIALRGDGFYAKYTGLREL